MRAKLLGHDKKIDQVKVEVTDDEGLKYLVLIPRPPSGRFPSTDAIVKQAMDQIRHKIGNPGKELFHVFGKSRSKIAAAKLAARHPGSRVFAPGDGSYYVIKKRTAKRNVPKKNHGPVKIYDQLLRIEAQKMHPHTYGGKPSRGGQKYFHDFHTKKVKVYGLPDGSLLIKG